MRKRAKKLLALLTAVTITVTGVNVPAAQAAKVKVTASKTTLYYNGTSAEKKATVTVKNVKGKKVTYSISKAGKKIVKLGDVSGNKTKKFTVTAKKKGTAKVTVKVAGKKVKTIKFTVKKKTAKATPNPTVAPTQAPTQEPSQEPSQEPTVAPSDAPTVAPSDAPSDAPTVAPTEEPVPEKPVVTEIKILNDVALTGNDGKEAYIYYDVLDQFGNSMRTSESINWTTSPSLKAGGNDRQLGRLTVEKNDKLTYGSEVFVVGVHVKSGISVNTSVKVGMAQAIDTIKVVGFVNKDDKSKLLTELPANFNKGSYYMVFEEYDQNGNKLDVDQYSASDVTFVSDNPMLMSVKSDGITNGAGVVVVPGTDKFTLDGESYAGVLVEPGMYVDKGGEVNVTVIANKTGTKSTQNIVIGTPGLLSSLELKAPSGIVADGDYNVKIPYEALDTEGKTITNYETIVRSSNKLSLSAGEGKLVIKQEDDGTAGIYWSDLAKYYPEDSAAYGQSGVANEIDRPISLTTIVVGGKSNNLMMNVSDIRIPTTISDVKLSTGDDFIIAGRQVDSTIGKVDDKLTFKDQYGKTMSAAVAKAFFTYANGNNFGSGSEAGKYGIHVQNLNATERFDENDDFTGFDPNSLVQKRVNTYGTAGLTISSADINLGSNNKQVATFKVSIYKEDTDGNKNDVSKFVTKNYDIIAMRMFSNYQIDGANETMYVETDHSTDKNASAVTSDDVIITGALTTANDSFKVKATYGSYTVAFGYDDIKVQTGVDEDNHPVYAADQRTTAGYKFVNADGAIKVSEVNAAPIVASGDTVRSAIKWSDLYDFDTTNHVRTGTAKVQLVVNVYNNVVKKKIAFNDEAPKLTEVKFMQNYGEAKTTTVNPYVTEIAAQHVSYYTAYLPPSYAGTLVINDEMAPLFDTTSKGGGTRIATRLDNFGYANEFWGDTTNTSTFIKNAGNNWGYTGVILATFDQYGRYIAPSNVKYTINSIKENTGDGAHKVESFEVANNGTATPAITGAEYGDTFDIKADVNDGDFTATVSATVKADLAAYITEAGNASDKQITDLLGITK